MPFLYQRLKTFAHDKLSIRKDIIASVVPKVDGQLCITDLLERMLALQNAIDTDPEFQNLLLLYDRIDHILMQAKKKYGIFDAQGFDSSRFKTSVEKKLYRKIEKFSESQKDYPKVLSNLMTLQGDLENYFDEVLVLCEDFVQRKQNLCFLQKIKDIFSPLANFSLIEKNSKK